MRTQAHRAGIARSKKGVAALKKAMTDKVLDAGLRKEIEELRNFRKAHKFADNGAELWVWGGIKWCGFAFKKPGWLMERLNKRDENDYSHVRSGEEYADNEVQGCPWDTPFGHGPGAHHQRRGTAGGLIRGILPGGVENRENVNTVFITGVNKDIIGVNYKALRRFLWNSPQ